MASTAKAVLVCAALAEGARIKESRRAFTPKVLSGNMRIKRPAFMMYDELHDDVVISQFGKETPLGVFNPINLPAASTILRIPRSEIGNEIASGNLKADYSRTTPWVKSGLQWPNKLSKTPSDYPEFTVVPDGFLPPGKSDGGVFLADPSGTVHRITAERKGGFYHEVEWHDFNGDGEKDMLTARVIKSGPFFAPKFDGELVWLENPGRGQMTRQMWKEHIVASGPDVIFKTKAYNGALAVYCTEFFGEVPRISVRLLSNSGVQTDFRIIDTTIGKPFAVNLKDLDGDGENELVVTNHQDSTKDEVKSAVYAYEIPSNLMTGEFKRHTLCYDVAPMAASGPGVGSPGFAEVFHPDASAPSSARKHLLVAGDGSFDVWYLTPKDSGRFDYDTKVIEMGGTTGQMLMMDFDNNGIVDALIPDNDNFNMRAITFE
jgi:hypothetical protein